MPWNMVTSHPDYSSCTTGTLFCGLYRAAAAANKPGNFMPDLRLYSVHQLASVDRNQRAVTGDRFNLLGPGSYRRKLWLSQEILVGIVKVIDFCLVLTAGTAAFALYLAVALHSTE